MDDLPIQQKQRTGVAAGQVKGAVLQVECLVLFQHKGGSLHVLGGGPAQRAAPPAHIKLVFRLCLAAQQGQCAGGAVQQNGIAVFPTQRERLDFFPPVGEIRAAVQRQAVVAAGLGDHPDAAVPVKHGGEREVERLVQDHTGRGQPAVFVKFRHRNVAVAGGHIKGFAEQHAPVEQRVGVPDARGLGQRRVRLAAQCGQRRNSLCAGQRADRDGINLLFAGQLAHQPPHRHMQSAIKLVHRNTFISEVE